MSKMVSRSVLVERHYSTGSDGEPSFLHGGDPLGSAMLTLEGDKETCRAVEQLLARAFETSGIGLHVHFDED